MRRKNESDYMPVLWFNLGIWGLLTALTFGGVLRPDIFSQGFAMFVVTMQTMIVIFEERDRA